MSQETKNRISRAMRRRYKGKKTSARKRNNVTLESQIDDLVVRAPQLSLPEYIQARNRVVEFMK